ncbi:MAG: hypothetical protein ABEJ02_00675 [Candidatus Paceibacteria bacterium]
MNNNKYVGAGLLSLFLLFSSLFVFDSAWASKHKQKTKGGSNPSLESSVEGQLDAASGRKEDPVAPQAFIAQVIKVALGFAGTVFLVLLLMAGYWLVTSRGRSEKIKKARKTALRAVVGLIIVLLSYSITLFVTEGVKQAGLQGELEQKEQETTNPAEDWFGL